VLLLDDAGRLAADCDSLLVHLLGHQADGVVMVISVNPFLPAGSLQSSIASFIRVNLHIPRLNAAESQQYIERALWVSGGTIRRLITPGALRMIVSVSKGMPGSINRVMESVFIAGFARGDARISASTVASVIGPGIAGGPRRDEARRPPSAVPPLIGVALLLIGLGAFLYRGLTGPAFHAQPTAQAPGPDDMAAVRASLLQAATAGDAAAALALATSYDPDFQTIGADPARAADWYRKAIALGDPQAGTLLAQMQAATGKPTAP
jgi:TPR repeat protein